jgi:hypothetical protein
MVVLVVKGWSDFSLKCLWIFIILLIFRISTLIKYLLNISARIFEKLFLAVSKFLFSELFFLLRIYCLL